VYFRLLSVVAMLIESIISTKFSIWQHLLSVIDFASIRTSPNLA